MKISKTLKKKYNKQYSNTKNIWREVGARKKADNILQTIPKDIKLERTIDIGCGEGSILKFLNNDNRFKEFYAINISESGIERTKEKNIPKLKIAETFDGYKTRYKNKYFNLAYSSHVLEHVEHPRVLLREIGRISKLQIFEIPIDFSFNVDKKTKHFLSYGHINIWTPSLFKFLLKSEGYEILDEKFELYSREIEQIYFKNKLLKRLKRKIFKVAFTLSPQLQKFKPDSFVVLCKYSGKKLDAF